MAGALVPAPSVQAPAAWAAARDGYRHKIHPYETAAGLTAADLVFGFDPLDLRRYDITDPDTAIANAILVARESNGGTIALPEGELSYSVAWDLSDARNITIKGRGGLSTGAQPSTRVAFTGTGSGIFINMQSANGCQLRDFALRPTDALFTGTLVDLSWSASNADAFRNSFRRMVIGDSTGKNCTHFNLEHSILTTFDEVNFVYSNPAVKGQKSDGTTYANVVKFKDCQFYQAQQTPVVYGGQAWGFDGCTFEQLADNSAGAFDFVNDACYSSGLAFENCWFGDASAGGGTWLKLRGAGITVHGNYFGGEATGTGAIALKNARGVKIIGNAFDTFYNALQFIDNTSRAVAFTGNNLATVTYAVVDLAYAPADFICNGNEPAVANTQAAQAAGYEVGPGGVIRQWGKITALTQGTPQNVTFPVEFPNAVHAVTFGVFESALNNTVKASSLATTGFTATLGNATGGDAAHVYWQAVGY